MWRAGGLGWLFFFHRRLAGLQHPFSLYMHSGYVRLKRGQSQVAGGCVNSLEVRLDVSACIHTEPISCLFGLAGLAVSICPLCGPFWRGGSNSEGQLVYSNSHAQYCRAATRQQTLSGRVHLERFAPVLRNCSFIHQATGDRVWLTLDGQVNNVSEGYRHAVSATLSHQDISKVTGNQQPNQRGPRLQPTHTHSHTHTIHSHAYNLSPRWYSVHWRLGIAGYTGRVTNLDGVSPGS